jgi:hypothetical protein
LFVTVSVRVVPATEKSNVMSSWEAGVASLLASQHGTLVAPAPEPIDAARSPPATTAEPVRNNVRKRLIFLDPPRQPRWLKKQAPCLFCHDRYDPVTDRLHGDFRRIPGKPAYGPNGVREKPFSF